MSHTRAHTKKRGSNALPHRLGSQEVIFLLVGNQFVQADVQCLGKFVQRVRMRDPMPLLNIYDSGRGNLCTLRQHTNGQDPLIAPVTQFYSHGCVDLRSPRLNIRITPCEYHTNILLFLQEGGIIITSLQQDTYIVPMKQAKKISVETQRCKPEGVAVRWISAVGSQRDIHLSTTRHFVYIVPHFCTEVKGLLSAKCCDIVDGG